MGSDNGAKKSQTPGQGGGGLASIIGISGAAAFVAVLWYYFSVGIVESPSAEEPVKSAAIEQKQPAAVKEAILPPGRDVLGFGKLPSGKIPLGIAISLHPFTGWGQQVTQRLTELGEHERQSLIIMFVAVHIRGCTYSNHWASTTRYYASCRSRTALLTTTL